jgi:hypothetical protein
MKKLAFPLACVLSAVASADAANILFVSFHQNDAPANAGATAAGFTSAPDIGYTDALRAAGHTVTRVLTSGTPNTAQLNAADLVIISRSVPSGDYELDAETAAWNGVTAPTLILGGYILRANRLGYVTASTAPVDTTGNVTLQATQPNHPIFQGITLGTGNTLAYAVPVSYTNNVQRGISVNTDPLAGGGTMIATVDPAGQPAGLAGGNGLLIAEWQAGAQMSTAPVDTLGGHRMVLLTGTRENGIASDAAGIYDLTPEGRQLFLNAVDYMAVPEPSTYALIGLGGIALFFRRRKH